MAIKSIGKFIKLESASGIILLAIAIAALIFDNTSLHHYYEAILAFPINLQLGPLILAKPLLMWINDGLMSIFFLLVGLEIKREIYEGELNSASKMALPSIAALGGMIFPALIYFFFNRHNSQYIQGWAIPTATDIAFALGILALLGSKVPAALKTFLTALAILDDLGAILVIAIFYTDQLAWYSLLLAALCLGVLLLFNRLGIKRFAPYGIVGFLLWICVLKSGVHATLAGVVLAFAIPLRSRKNSDYSPLRQLEHSLHPWVAFGVLPMFAFANAGINFSGTSLNTLLHSIPLGIGLGLFLGKQVGIFSVCWLAIKTKLVKLPTGVNWKQLYGLSILCGVGFTMSLFIGTLAFNEASDLDYARLVRIGVFAGSILSGILGYSLLLLTSKLKKTQR